MRHGQKNIKILIKKKPVWVTGQEEEGGGADKKERVQRTTVRVSEMEREQGERKTSLAACESTGQRCQ